MPQFLRSLNKDWLGATILIALGAGVLYLGFGYQVGTLNRMGAGFIPAVLGSLLIIVGVAIALTTTVPVAAPTPLAGHAARAPGVPEWRGWICIVGGVTAFVIFGRYGGFILASFASVFISAMGDRLNTVRSAAVLATIVTVFGTLIFHFGLRLQLPLFSWG